MRCLLPRSCLRVTFVGQARSTPAPAPARATTHDLGVVDMSLIHGPRFTSSDPADTAASDRAPTPVPSSSGEPAVIYMLVYNDPDHPAAGYGVGWALVVRYETTWYWWTSLAARGAGAFASARVAQAVSVRVLAEQGVAVEGWTDTGPEQSDAQPGGVAGFRARVISPPQTEPPLWDLQRAASRGLRGH